MATIHCPHCAKSIGGSSSEGGFRVRLGIVLLDPDTGAVSGPCPHCKTTIEVSKGGELTKAFKPRRVVPGLRLSKPT